MEQLHRHQRRRAQGIPTLSVLGAPAAGDPEAPDPIALWSQWAGALGRPTVLAVHPGPEEITHRWVEHLAASRSLAGDIEAKLAALTKVPPLELRRKTAVELDLFFDRAASALTAPRSEVAPDTGPLTVAALRVCRRILDVERGAPRRGSLAADLDALLTGDDPRAWRVLAALCAIVPRAAGPAILLASSAGSERERAPVELSARLLAELAAAVPELPVALLVPLPDLGAYLRGGPESRAKAMLREGLIPGATVSRVGLPTGLDRAPPTLDVTRTERTERTENATPPDLAAAGEPRTGDSFDSMAADGARSEAERFLFARLEERPATAGLFELNGTVRLEGGAVWEIDLLCRIPRVAVEIDGFYHFQDHDAYRRDRAKDLALQRSGFLVLRFLADDVVARLETILSTIQQALAFQRSNPPRSPSGS